MRRVRRTSVLIAVTTIAVTLAGCSRNAPSAKVVSAGPLGSATTAPGGATSPTETSPFGTNAPSATTTGRSATTPAPSTTLAPAPAGNGKLAWSACAEPAGYQCATLQVPLDYANPSGKTISIAVNRRPANDLSKRIGALVVNPGGPGASGLELAVNLPSELPAALLDRFDLVGFDPRGVGQSTPVECSSDADKDRLLAVDDLPTSSADVDALVDAQLQASAACASKGGDLLTHVSTSDAARDIDQLRQALGEDKLTYLGFSYGTRLGAVYADLFPGKIRAFVLDGVENPSNPSGINDDGYQSFIRAFDRFAAACNAAASCPAGPDAKALRDKLFAQARTSPIPSSGDSRRLTVGLVDQVITDTLYDRRAWPILGQGMADAAAGDGSILLSLFDLYEERHGDGTYSNLRDALRAVGCADDPERHTADEVKAAAAKVALPAKPFDFEPIKDLAWCTAMPVGPSPYKPITTAAGAPPILVIGTVGDPVTGVENAQKLASALGSGVPLIWEGEGHTAFPSTDCVNKIVVDYLTDLKVPAAGTHCPATAAGTPAVAEYKLDREQFRPSLERAISQQTSSSRLVSCVVSAMIDQLTDPQFIHTVIAGASRADIARVQALATECIRKG